MEWKPDWVENKTIDLYSEWEEQNEIGIENGKWETEISCRLIAISGW